MKSWNGFNSLKGSSTRTEVAANILSMLSDSPVTLGTDSLSMHKKTKAIAKHMVLNRSVKYNDKKGVVSLGGEISWLHRDRPQRRRWACTMDGDLWCLSQKMIAAKGPNSVATRKVKGHATSEMVAMGTVRQADKEGNDHAGEAAGFGS